jgi:hypothetical protein
MGCASSTYGKEEKCIQILVGNAEGRRPHESPKHRWKDNIKIDLKQIEWCCGNWIRLVRDRALVKTVMNLGFHTILGIA